MIERRQVKEVQNQVQIDAYRTKGPVRLGPWTSHIWRSDPKHLGFLLARYKFCAKMLAGKTKVLEIGCGDGFGLRVVLQSVGFVQGVDFEPLVLKEAKGCLEDQEGDRCAFSIHDLSQAPVKGKFDAAYALDVLEHISPRDENRFLENIRSSLDPHAVCILGTPNAEARQHASPASAAGHVNLKSAQALGDLLARFFHNVFVFSMNDEVVHTGFYPMSHYLLGMGVGTRRRMK